ncbi:uncharacterized protein E5676_scaffold237G001710 [Cucumis melo var. makuwa]|uniref:Uncharacterized protein n=1 Tax=Cucumis melo var. makuwa TaxID=1194695 RepID=A0A5A7T8Q2_CUCMM|nr:uncharacterized protein E6C27_scaffold36G002170 [Cucumis melo var. makuwa]TYK20576.1 uncharacterized protein E5676_scaffold237G001710 [Cucumis melo var. makuwa]
MYEENDVGSINEMIEVAHQEYSKDLKEFEKLLNDAEKPLYEGCKKFTKVSTLVKLYNLKVRRGWSDISFSELLKTLKEILHPTNEIPTSKNEYADATGCPEYGESRWKYGNSVNGGKRRFLEKLYDSPAWKLVDLRWPNFGSKPRNIHLALSMDGINPHGIDRLNAPLDNSSFGRPLFAEVHFKPEQDLLYQAHRYVLANTIYVQPYM